MAVDGEGQLHVADRLRHAISLYDPDGRFVADLKPPAEAPFTAPLGVSFDRSGRLLVADATKENHSVLILDSQGKLVRRLGQYGDGPGKLLFPNQAVADSRGRIYVSNGNAMRVDLFGADGGYVGPLATGSARGAVGMPRGLAVDHQDRLFVVDSVGCVVHVFDVSGDKPAFLYSFGSEGIGDGQMLYPMGIAVDATGRVYVADRTNYRLQVWSY
jgi:sugar lactone lactonase YvrE